MKSMDVCENVAINNNTGAGISFRSFIEILLVAAAEVEILSRIMESVCITSQIK